MPHKGNRRNREEEWVPLKEEGQQALRIRCDEWLEHRSCYPPRAFNGTLTFTGRPKPGKKEHRAWHVYEKNNGVQFQQWVMVPTLNLVPQPTEKLVLSPDEANLQRFITPCQKFWREHWTNIQRIKALAERHPEVGTVENHKELQKARDKSEFDENGRAIRNHQSPFDLLLTLAATGAAMYVGVTVNEISGNDTEHHQGGLIALWWQARNNPSTVSVAEAIFFDITELSQKIPSGALGDLMLSPPAASASGGQAALSSGPPPTSALPPAESPQPPQEAEDNREAEAKPAMTVEGPHHEDVEPDSAAGDDDPPESPAPESPDWSPARSPAAEPLADAAQPLPAPKPAQPLGIELVPELQMAAVPKRPGYSLDDTCPIHDVPPAKRPAITPKAPPPAPSQRDQEVPEPESYPGGQPAQARRRRRSASPSCRDVWYPWSWDKQSGEIPSLYERRLSAQDIEKLGPNAKAKLGAVTKKENTQRHFQHSWWLGGHDQEHDGRQWNNTAQPLAGRSLRAELLDELPIFANPIPFVREWLKGIHHKNTYHPWWQLWDPVRALASYKLITLEQLYDKCDWPVSMRGGERGRLLPFTSAYPDTRGTGGVKALTPVGWYGLWVEFGIETEEQFVKHLLNFHDGEVRFVGPNWWEEVPEHGLNHTRYWHSQTMRTEKTRRWCWQSHGGGLEKGSPWKERHLYWRDVRWLMQEEGNETLLMKYCPATGGRPDSWHIRQGNCITLGELFNHGADKCSCWDLYRTWTNLDIFVHKKPHSVSHSPEGTFRANAKRWNFETEGRWGLPYHGGGGGLPSY